MNRKFLWAALIFGGIVVYASSCSKESADKLAAATTCDTTDVSYSKQVLPILQDNCYSCHGQGNTAGSGGIDLSTYTALKVYAQNGFLVGNVSHAPGYNPMPYGLPELPSCEINTITAWVNQGILNN